MENTFVDERVIFVRKQNVNDILGGGAYKREFAMNYDKIVVGFIYWNCFDEHNRKPTFRNKSHDDDVFNHRDRVTRIFGFISLSPCVHVCAVCCL